MKAWYALPPQIEYSKEDSSTRDLLSKFLIENNIEFIPTNTNYQEFEAKIRIRKDSPPQADKKSRKKQLKDEQVRQNINKLLGLIHKDSPFTSSQDHDSSPRTPRTNEQKSSKAQLTYSKSDLIAYSPAKLDNPNPRSVLQSPTKIIMMPEFDSGEPASLEKSKVKSPKAKVPLLHISKENLNRYADMYQHDLVYTKVKSPTNYHIPETSKAEKSPQSYKAQFDQWYKDKKESPMKSQKVNHLKPKYEKYISSEKKCAWSDLNDEARVLSNKINQLVTNLKKDMRSSTPKKSYHIPKATSKSPINKERKYVELHAQDRIEKQNIRKGDFSPKPTNVQEDRYKSPSSPYRSSRYMTTKLTPSKSSPYGTKAASPEKYFERSHSPISKEKPPMPKSATKSYTKLTTTNSERTLKKSPSRSVSPTPSYSKLNSQQPGKKKSIQKKDAELSMIREYESSKLKKTSSMKSILFDLEYESPPQRRDDHNGSISLNFQTEPKGKSNYSTDSPFKCKLADLE